VHKGSPADNLIKQDGTNLHPLQAGDDFILGANSKETLDKMHFDLRKPLIFKDIQQFARFIQRNEGSQI